jgi:peptide deformylase
MFGEHQVHQENVTPAPGGQPVPITVYGTPVLHRPCAPVTTFDHRLRDLVADMFASMVAAEGVGLAANQIGLARRVFVFDCPDATGTRRVGHVVNPVLHLPPPPRALVEDVEGCLSVPGQHTVLARPAAAEVTGVDADGHPVTVVGTGLLARCLQHEVDHLDGLVFVDRLPAKQRKRLLAAAGLGSRPR